MIRGKITLELGLHLRCATISDFTGRFELYMQSLQEKSGQFASKSQRQGK